MLKRLFDICFSAAALVIVLPICAFLFPLVKLDSRGAFFFRQVRMGKNGKLFRIFKIRTMKVFSENGDSVTCRNDPRVTRMGTWLRSMKIDELPQFINVFLGQMSVVGPRPDLPKYKDVNSEMWEKILSVRPGITDTTSLRYFNEEENIPEDGSAEDYYRMVILPGKQKMYLEYLDKQSLLYDLLIIVRTAGRLIFR